MKNFFSVIISIIILSLSFSFTAFANDPVLLSIQDEKVYAGDTFTVNVFISYDSQMSGAVIDVNYDSKMLEFISAKEGGILDSSATISIKNIKNKKSFVRFAYMSGASSVTMDGIIFSITFKALESASGNTKLDITIPNPKDFVNENLEVIDYTVDNAEISVLNNISIEVPTEEQSSESTTLPEPEETQSTETTTNNIIDDTEEKDNNDYTIIIILLLIGIALVCFGVAIALKKRK
ncbi:MAG: hypothetical protein IJZ16_02130 [Clostridia bacterium]|nr:hypothetical protein [Clostridia bacterium]